MKIVFVGGGTGGHFYPLIAVAEEIDSYAQENQLVQPKKYYFAPKPYDEKALYNAGIKYIYCPAGKLRRTKDLASKVKNFFSLFSILFGILKAIPNLFLVFPDVVFSKGGYASFPTLLAARLLRIPVVIHESDASLGQVNKWSASFATNIAIAFSEVESELSAKEKTRTAKIGIPIRQELLYKKNERAHTLLKIDPEVPTIVILGGSSGAEYINNTVLDTLPILLKEYQVIHITGEKHIEAVKKETDSLLRGLQNLKTYHPIAFLNTYYMATLYSVADIIITRAGSGTLFEIAEWGIPSIIVPIPEEISHDQRKNAYAYARAAGGIVVEQKNLQPNLLVSQINSILKDEKYKETLKKRAKQIATPDAGKKAAQLLVSILKSHES